MCSVVYVHTCIAAHANLTYMAVHVNLIFLQADQDGDGTVSLPEFLVFFKAVLELEDEFLLGEPDADGSVRKVVPKGILQRAANKASK